jgi:hypothetical protein
MGWIERGQAERKDLNAKIEELALFLTSDDAILLGDLQRSLLGVQLGVMQSYSAILDVRLNDGLSAARRLQEGD